MNKIITLLALCCAVNAGDFQTSTNSLGEVTLEKYTPEKMRSIVLIPSHVSKIGVWAFQNRIEVRTVHLPNKTRQIGTGAFYGCSNLRNVRLSPETKTIGTLAFARCVSLESVITLPGCELGDRVFEGCYSLGAWTPWIDYRRTGDSFTVVFEGFLQGSTNIADWVDLPQSSGVRTIGMKETVNYYRARE